MTSSEICFVPANGLAGMIRDRDVSVQEVMEAHLARIERGQLQGKRHHHIDTRRSLETGPPG